MERTWPLGLVLLIKVQVILPPGLIQPGCDVDACLTMLARGNDRAMARCIPQDVAQRGNTGAEYGFMVGEAGSSIVNPNTNKGGTARFALRATPDGAPQPTNCPGNTYDW